MEKTSNFKRDALEGEIGEEKARNWLKYRYKDKNWDIVDVSKSLLFQLKDIDVIAITDGKKRTIEEIEAAYRKVQTTSPSWAKSFEIKTDGRTYVTRNLVFEISSHDGPGWAGKCAADYVIYACGRNEWNINDTKEVFLIDMRGWRKWVRTLSGEKEKVIRKLLKATTSEEKDKYIEELRVYEEDIWDNNFDRDNSNVLNKLTKIESIQEKAPKKFLWTVSVEEFNAAN